jgi:hypothetical protein
MVSGSVAHALLVALDEQAQHQAVQSYQQAATAAAAVHKAHKDQEVRHRQEALDAHGQHDPVFMVAVPTMVTFALSPGTVVTEGVLDYSSEAGRNVFESATAPFIPKYNGSQVQLGLCPFLHHLHVRSRNHGWQKLLFDIPVGNRESPPVVTRSLLTQFSEITIDDVRTHAETYIHKANRARQASHQLWAALSCSLGDDILQRLLSRNEEYCIAGVEDGPMMLRVLISLCAPNTG